MILFETVAHLFWVTSTKGSGRRGGQEDRQKKTINKLLRPYFFTKLG